MSRFPPPNFVTEKAENRDVTLFGSIQNAKNRSDRGGPVRVLYLGGDGVCGGGARRA